ncbi:MAG: PEP/pyruvate-binding domain-containing protein [Desulfatiglans sp.]|jgi:pyruvate,water dikinase|nr:PEP/pyruvate-binding domain-containing protein [Thermodesulfobacteriota bacterium]MEE4353969.1 PEP/pyruvate-binding domain-containing protein [Desulfatiglans sp.]
MGKVLKYLKRLVYKKRELDEIEVEELRNAFKDRYHHFKLLLSANNKALDVMAEMEEALQGGKPFGMTHVKSWCTLIATNVWQIIQHLNELAPLKYEELYERFKEIQMKINPFLVQAGPFEDGRLTISLNQIDKNLTDQVGSKMANLGEIKNRTDIQVSSGFAVTARAYHRFMAHNDLQTEIDRRIQAADISRIDQLYELSSDIQQLIIRASIPRDLEEDIWEQYGILEQEAGKQGVTVSMRSSALGEDFAETSFAGQYRSMLNVSRENLFQSYKEIVAGKYGVQAMAYRLNRGIRDEDVAMCVGCISMVDAVSGGVVYSRNPMNTRDETIYINSVWGLPKTVVDGSAATDLFMVSRTSPMKIIKKEIPVKEREFVCYPDEGVCRMDITGNKAGLASLDDNKALELARLAMQLEAYYGSPQDIEWAVTKDGATVLLQCRPLKQAGANRRNGHESAHEKHLDELVFQEGTTASPGVGAGPVFIIRKDMEALQFPEGAVLVTPQALPRWATVLNRAAAVLTEQGSITGHLANVAREFGVPAVFGIKHLIDRLQKGQWITVDADNQRIYKGRIEDLLKEREPPKNLMEGSPVFEAAKGAGGYIIPLNLLDPDAPEFRPKHCTTFHDITRFCHEKVVIEMFRFGKDHHFPERSSKQLYCDVAMQWWVLNLDDGFSEEIEGKFIRLEEICSIPMLALWEGIATVPWEGPPPINGKGLMSVMFEATTNRALTPGVRSQYASRNYFMISKHYCSLTSRLGFHFSTVEAMVSERSSENYISFQFMGGAANYERRKKRVFFVKDILEEHDFRVEIRKDNLIARLEDRDMAFMKDHLKILGYLTIHTRQLDMVMTSDVSINHYRSKITQDIQKILHAHQDDPSPHSPRD